MKRTPMARRPARNPLPADVREAVYERDGMCCVRCGISVLSAPRSVHHRQPRGAGGTASPAAHRLSLLVLVCGTGVTGCHGDIESHRTAALAGGWLISKFEAADPQTIPLHLPDGDQLLLADDGTRTRIHPAALEVSPR